MQQPPASPSPADIDPQQATLSEGQNRDAASEATHMLAALGQHRPAINVRAAQPQSPAQQPASSATTTSKSGHPATQYLRNKILTATPEQLQLMLYDGAIRFADQGKTAILERKFERSYELLTRAQRILTELQCSLKPEVAPELAKNLASLYTFAYLRLVDANVMQDASKVDDALKVLRYQRETWAMLMQRAATEKAAEVAGSINVPSVAEDDDARKVSQQTQVAARRRDDGSHFSLAG